MPTHFCKPILTIYVEYYFSSHSAYMGKKKRCPFKSLVKPTYAYIFFVYFVAGFGEYGL